MFCSVQHTDYNHLLPFELWMLYCNTFPEIESWDIRVEDCLEIS